MSARQLLLYIVKCAVGCAATYLLCFYVSVIDLRWCLVSVVLVLSPESREEVQLAMTRIKANLLAAISSMACLLLGPANVLTLSLAFGMTTLLCYAFKLMAGNRSALAAVIIIMIRDETGFHWLSAIGRVGSVIVGCLVALVVTFVFHLEFWRKSFTRGSSPEVGIQGDE